MTDPTHPTHPTTSDRSGGGIQLEKLLEILRGSRLQIALAASGSALLCLILGLAIYLRSPAHRSTSITFRLDFAGAARGQYPNGLKFSPSDIIDTPVLLQTYNANALRQYVSFSDFSKAFVVAESNRALQALAADYQSRLSDPKLTPLDRERVEREYQAKREGISKSEFVLILSAAETLRRIPPEVAEKIVRDVLQTWARQAVIKKKILNYRMSVLSKNVLEGSIAGQREYIVALILLRDHSLAILRNIDQMRETPGIELVRVGPQQVSLEEVRVQLEDLVRFDIEPLIVVARDTGFVTSRDAITTVLEAQLAHHQRRLAALKRREEALRSALAIYDQSRFPTGGADSLRERQDGQKTTQGETIMPQISETFLDRVVDLATQSADREYRQRMVDDIRRAAIDIIPGEQAVEYSAGFLSDFRAGRAAPPQVPAQAVATRLAAVKAGVGKTLKQLVEIYAAATELVNPEAELFSVTGPVTTKTQYGVSTQRLVLWSLLTVLLTTIMAVAIALVRNRISEEQARANMP